jgi:hypothetical protein
VTESVLSQKPSLYKQPPKVQFSEERRIISSDTHHIQIPEKWSLQKPHFTINVVLLHFYCKVWFIKNAFSLKVHFFSNAFL